MATTIKGMLLWTAFLRSVLENKLMFQRLMLQVSFWKTVPKQKILMALNYICLIDILSQKCQRHFFVYLITESKLCNNMHRFFILPGGILSGKIWCAINCNCCETKNRNMPRLDIVKRNIAISASKLGSQNMLFLNFFYLHLTSLVEKLF